MKHRLEATVSALLLLLAFAVTAGEAAAAPIMGWDSTNHQFVVVSADGANFQIAASQQNTGSNLLPDVLNISCPAQQSVANGATQTCFVAPNDGHTYQVVAWDVSSAAARGGTCADSIEVAGSGVAAGSGLGAVTPVACSTPSVPVNAVVGYAATPTVGATTPTPTPPVIAAGGRINYVPTISATTTPAAVNGTLTIKRLS